MEIAGVVLIVAGIVVVWGAEVTASGRLGINGLIGLRFGALLMSDRAWHLGHRAARVPIDLAGAFLILTGILVLTLDLPEDAVGILVIFGAIAALAMIILGSVLGSREANRVLGEDNESSSS